MSETKYIRVTKGLNDKGILVSPEDYKALDLQPDQDYYSSIHYYNELQFRKFKETGSISGITDVKTDKLVFDLDYKTDLEVARQDTLTIVKRLEDIGINKSKIQFYFSGQKGFTVVVNLKQYLSPERLANIALNVIGKNIKTLDTSLYNASRLLRVPNTRHPVTGLFKIPLTFNQLSKLKIETIKENAVRPGSTPPVTESVELSEELIKEELKAEEKTQLESRAYSLELTKKPSQWKNCKWSLLQGNFDSGERHNALMVIAATCRGLGYDKNTTYYMCKSALKKQAARTGYDEFSKEELYKNIIEQSVFKDNWEGGQFSCKTSGWLQSYCNRLGEHKCKDREVEDKPCVNFDDMTTNFLTYAKDFEKNVIRTGIKGLDNHLILCTSTLNGLLGNPGSGKTTMALNYLRNTSLSDIPSVFLSLDMGMPLVYGKLIQKRLGLSFEKVMELFRDKPSDLKDVVSDIKKEYKNVGFNFRSGLTVPDIKTVIKEHEETLGGKKVKLLVIDYLECLAGPYSDATANFGFIANQLKDLANEMEICILLLLQTQKHSTPDIADPLLSLKGVKGSSIIEQSCTVILTLWREGYNPKHVEDDKYISFAIVKNRFGSLWSGDFGWNPVSGDITGLTEEQKWELENFKERKVNEKAENEAKKKEEWS